MQLDIAKNRRIFRHLMFWITWVLSFTFIKSFEAAPDIYLAWLVYYIVTLPIFITHTYLIVYWAGKKFLKGSLIIIFILLFIMLTSCFSFLELIITNGFLSKLFPYVFSLEYSILNMKNILISGVGNLYILIVFVAIKKIREWYNSDNQKQEIVKRSLFLERADVNAGIQPGMLLFVIGEIEQLAISESEHTPAAIALLSELLNAVMQAQHNLVLRVDEEVRNVKRMLKLYSLILNTSTPRLIIEGNELSMKTLPAFIMFSPLDIILRNYKKLPGDTIHVTIQNSEQINITWETEESNFIGVDSTVISREMNNMYPEIFHIESAVSEKDNTIIVTTVKQPELVPGTL